jgi:hypothetical protein
MQIATWNVNSLKVRLPQVLDWLAAHPVDVLCLQETKLIDDRFPAAELAGAGYESVFSGQPTYNGVAILCRRETVGAPSDVVIGNPLFPDEQKRLISATVAGLRVVCAYFPNGQAVDSDKYDYKLRWIDALIEWIAPQLPAEAQAADATGRPIALQHPKTCTILSPGAGRCCAQTPNGRDFVRSFRRGSLTHSVYFRRPIAASAGGTTVNWDFAATQAFGSITSWWTERAPRA